jgi:isoleucyl-tRNA synthetase
MYDLLDSLVRLMAPLLPFTAEEIWSHMPEYSDKLSSVHLSVLPEANPRWKDEPLADKWATLLKVRAETTKALEEARAKKKIGHPLDATVILSVKDDVYGVLEPYADDLRFIFIVSNVSLLKDQKLDDSFVSENVEGLAIRIETAPGKKCERCWVYETSVGSDSNRPTICTRCQESLDEMS